MNTRARLARLERIQARQRIQAGGRVLYFSRGRLCGPIGSLNMADLQKSLAAYHAACEANEMPRPAGGRP
jgi:hypothetical protein